MTTAQGSNAQLLYGEESTFKTMPGSPAGTILAFTSDGGLGQKTSLGTDPVIKGNRNPSKPFQNTKEVSGSIQTTLTPFLGTLLKHALGTVATTGTDPYTHTFKIGDLPVGLWFEKGFTDIAEYIPLNGCRINSMSISVSGQGGVVPVTFDVMGAVQGAAAGASVDASPTDPGYSPFMNFEASIKEGGSTIAVVTEMSLQITNNLDGSAYYIGGNGERGEIPAGTVAVSGSITAMFDSMTLYNKAVNFTESSLELTLSRGDGLGTAGNESLIITLPELIFEEQMPPVDGPQGVRVQLPFQAFYENAAEATAMQMVLKNAVATY